MWDYAAPIGIVITIIGCIIIGLQVRDSRIESNNGSRIYVVSSGKVDDCIAYLVRDIPTGEMGFVMRCPK